MKKLWFTGLLLLILTITGCDSNKSAALTTINLNNEIANSKTGSFENGILKTDSLTLKIVGYEVVKKNEYSDYLKDTAQYSILVVKFEANSNLPNSTFDVNSAFLKFFSAYQDNEPLPVELYFAGMISPLANSTSIEGPIYYPSVSYALKDDNSDFTLVASKGFQFLGKQRLKNPNNPDNI